MAWVLHELQAQKTPLHRAAECGDTDTVRQLIGTHINIDSEAVVGVFKFGWFIMSLAVAFVVQNGKTALHLASEQDHVSVVQMLIGAHAKVNLKDKVLYTQGIKES